jgi:hypothetical protein
MMDYIPKVEAFLNFSFEDFPNEDSLPSDLKFSLKYFEPTLIFEKELDSPCLGFFTQIKVEKSEYLKLTTFIAPQFTMHHVSLLEKLLAGLVEIYGSDGKGLLYLHPFELEKIENKTWEGRYWEFNEFYNEIDVSVYLEKGGDLSLNFYKRSRPWLEDDEDEDY